MTEFENSHKHCNAPSSEPAFRIVHSKMQISSMFTHPHVSLNFKLEGIFFFFCEIPKEMFSRKSEQGRTSFKKPKKYYKSIIKVVCTLHSKSSETICQFCVMNRPKVPLQEVKCCDRITESVSWTPVNESDLWTGLNKSMKRWFIQELDIRTSQTVLPTYQVVIGRMS